MGKYGSVVTHQQISPELVIDDGGQEVHQTVGTWEQKKHLPKIILGQICNLWNVFGSKYDLPIILKAKKKME